MVGAESNGTQDLWDYVPDELRVRYDELLVSIPHAARVAAQSFPDFEAIVDDGVRLTFAELEDAMLDAVRGMIAMGIRPGDRVAVWAPNCAQWILAALGIQGAGGVLVPLNTRFKGEEAAYVLNKSGATALVVANGFLGTDYVQMLREADPDLAVLRPGRVVIVNGVAREGEVAWDDFISAGQVVSRDEATASIDAVGSDTVSDIMFTSGTTGHPKGVMLTHGQSLRAHGWLSKVMDFRAGDRYLIIPPFFHTFGYKSGWMACIVHGVTILPEPVFSVPKVLKVIDEQKISILEGPPTLFQGILDAPDRDAYDLSSIASHHGLCCRRAPELIARMRDG
ncbi:AMP-binding protein [Aeromicrobium sp. UC242_57]|uniref:AMP-binding protein n=1 Tax=Aeromicrobium sp. UC242_57 TaxID=3374624 RepID=UPI0037A1EB35